MFDFTTPKTILKSKLFAFQYQIDVSNINEKEIKVNKQNSFHFLSFISDPKFFESLPTLSKLVRRHLVLYMTD